jgi:hypothetical protein
VSTEAIDLLLVSTLVVFAFGLLAVVFRQATLLRRATDRADRLERLMDLTRYRTFEPMSDATQQFVGAHRRVGVR